MEHGTTARGTQGEMKEMRRGWDRDRDGMHMAPSLDTITRNTGDTDIAPIEEVFSTQGKSKFQDR